MALQKLTGRNNKSDLYMISTYVGLRSDEFIIKLSRPAYELIEDTDAPISIQITNPHEGAEDLLALSIIRSLITNALSQQCTDSSEAAEKDDLWAV